MSTLSFRGQPPKEHRVASDFQVAEYAGRLSVPGRGKKRVQFARRHPETIAGHFIGTRHQPRNQVRQGGQATAIEDLHPGNRLCR